MIQQKNNSGCNDTFAQNYYSTTFDSTSDDSDLKEIKFCMCCPIKPASIAAGMFHLLWAMKLHQTTTVANKWMLVPLVLATGNFLATVTTNPKMIRWIRSVHYICGFANLAGAFLLYLSIPKLAHEEYEKKQADCTKLLADGIDINGLGCDLSENELANQTLRIIMKKELIYVLLFLLVVRLYLGKKYGEYAEYLTHKDLLDSAPYDMNPCDA